jgi:hypothetical protein
MTMTMRKKVVQWAMMLALAAMTWAGFVQEGKADSDFGSPDFMKWEAGNCDFKNFVMECNDENYNEYRDATEDINYGFDDSYYDQDTWVKGEIFYFNSWETYVPKTTMTFNNILDMDLDNLHFTKDFFVNNISGYNIDYGVILGDHTTNHMGFRNQFNPIYSPFQGVPNPLAGLPNLNLDSSSNPIVTHGYSGSSQYVYN